MSQRNNTVQLSNKVDIQLTLQAIQKDATLTVSRAATIYKVLESTLRRRRAGMLSQRNWKPKSINLTGTKEEVIV
ncbi:uncharacterized protein M421DRAFT_389062 [Didymella exigua CBS 183.55]|uniref:HTH psq-type domain-containing protein n=1 Tax=Didymella exigua CBS 183.55 TaxID=1150837 RepID=A0A6A5S1D3_9PLEO|nr:uncharacterized protein M421DRAFT_389062 [Didymella exigua CBS 183.55]KAF1934451.1 hypothetical protein M421DRAFT_389062 [Didymella exigua CBS 183.55]